MPTEIYVPPGAACIIISLIPTLAFTLVTGNFNIFANLSFTIPFINIVVSGLSMWIVFVVSLGLIIAASINALSTGLNDTGSQILLVAGLSGVVFLVVSGTWSSIGLPMPYSSYMETFMTFLFALGVYLMISKS